MQKVFRGGASATANNSIRQKGLHGVPLSIFRPAGISLIFHTDGW
jgi:hypothetical protein